jgi:NAD(P)-dependent dehydrogenase (short-subunit alcohol dehydrogenase family)
MRDDFAGRTALVTGGGTGLGLEISTQLGRRGARVVCASRDRAHHAELRGRAERDGFAVESVELDVRDATRVKEVVRGLDRVDVLVNNAAGNFIRPSMMLAPKAFATVLDIALNGVFYVSRECGRRMRDSGGSIVNISAPYAFSGKPGVVHSACAKAGVESMTRTLAAEWAEYGIRVNAVSPGPFESEGAADRLWPSGDLEEKLLADIPAGRLANADEIARLVCLLASDDAAYVTGSVIVADGGWSLPKPLGDLRKVDRRRR